ncbi:MAG: lytic transglycosylase domain-containing protein [Brevinema sp.]
MLFSLVFLIAAQEVPKELLEVVNDTTILELPPQEPSLEVEKPVSLDLFDMESDLMIEEYKGIVQLYQNPPSDTSTKIRLYQRLLARLNEMQPTTAFLEGHRDLLKNVLRYHLGLNDRATQCLKKLMSNTKVPSIRNDALDTLISFNYPNKLLFNNLYQSYTNFFSKEQIGYLDVIIRSLTGDISSKESDMLLKNTILAPFSLYQQESFKTKLLNNIQQTISIEEFYKSINVAFYNEDYRTALSLIRIQIKNTSVDFHTLSAWAKQLGSYEKDLVDSLRIYQRRSDDYKNYVEAFHYTTQAKTRGKIFHRRLYAYRGLPNAPYNVLLTKQVLEEYLQGAVESEYIEKNAKRALRNFLAYQQYDLVLEYAQKMREKIAPQISPYVNFWESFALLKTGNTNDVVPLLGSILTVAPESYCGIVGQKKLRQIFNSTPLSFNRYISGLKKQSTSNRQALLDYAHVLYYMGNRLARGTAEQIFVDQGLIVVSSSEGKFSTREEGLIKSYAALNLSKNIKRFAYQKGITSIHDQDVLLAQYYYQENNILGIQHVIANGHKILNKKNSFSISKKAMQVYFPRPYQELIQDTLAKSKHTMDPYLLYSVMRAESFYKEKARSHAGAMGLMQIMPVTGKWLVSKYLSELEKYSLYTPEVNVYLGSVYLYDNISQVGILPALAAYNSGPTFVRSLIKQYKSHTDLELVEIHPKSETRNYVRKVIESYERYSKIYNNNTADFLQKMS